VVVLLQLTRIADCKPPGNGESKAWLTSAGIPVRRHASASIAYASRPGVATSLRNAASKWEEFGPVQAHCLRRSCAWVGAGMFSPIGAAEGNRWDA